MRLAVAEYKEQWGLYHVVMPNEDHELLSVHETSTQAEQAAIDLSCILSNVSDPDRLLTSYKKRVEEAEAERILTETFVTPVRRASKQSRDRFLDSLEDLIASAQ